MFGRKKPKEVTETLNTLRSIEAELATTTCGVGIQIIKHDVARLISADSKKTVLSITADKMNYRDLVFLLITNVLDEHLCSGQYHTYRGVLSGNGQSLLVLWDRAVDEMHKSGFQTIGQAEEEKNWIREQVRTVG